MASFAPPRYDEFLYTSNGTVQSDIYTPLAQNRGVSVTVVVEDNGDLSIDSLDPNGNVLTNLVEDTLVAGDSIKYNLLYPTGSVQVTFTNTDASAGTMILQVLESSG